MLIDKRNKIFNAVLLVVFLFSLLAIPQAGKTVAAQAGVVINEIRIDQDSTDNDEYFELAGDPGTSLDGLTYLVIGDGTGGSGVIEAVASLAGQVIPTSGYFVAAESTFTLGTPDLVTSLNFENSDNVTHLLVSGFSGSNGQDLDTDDDGVLDITPWAELVDLIALVKEENPPTSTEYHYGPPQIGPDGSFVPGHVYRCTDGWQIGPFSPLGAKDTPGAENACVVVVPEGCGDPFTPIYTVQGSGSASSLDGSEVAVEGVVTGDFQANNQLKGFFLQDAQGDGDPATSDGVFVYAPGSIDVNTGDIVRVRGIVDEYYNYTEITAVSNVWACGTAVPLEPTVVTLPVSSISDLEVYEGMLVGINQQLTVTGNYTTGRYGEVDLSVSGRLFTPTHVVLPGADAQALQDLNNRSRILLDDASSIQNPLPLPPYFGPDLTLRTGDTLPGLVGNLAYGFNLYRIQPTQDVTFTRVNEREAVPEEVGGTLKVASFNVLNYFNGDGLGGGFPTSRGAGTSDEFTRQRDKIINAIATLDADVVGLMEIENDGYGETSAIQDLVNGLNAVAGDGTYAFIDPGLPQIGTDEITVGLLYKPAKVFPVGMTAILDTSIDPDFLDTKNRPPLIQSFEQVGKGERFTVAVNHLKSKGSDCNDVNDPDTGDGQGNCNMTRTKAAQALVRYLATYPTGIMDPDMLIIGDLNAYGMEDPIAAIESAGYMDLAKVFIGPQSYTYVFSGQSGSLDHALASSHMQAQVTGTTIWHINADEPVALDYNDYNQPALYTSEPYSSSDHDPVLVGLDLQPQLEDFVVLGEQAVLLQPETQIASGDVGVNSTLGKPFYNSRSEAVLHPSVKVLDPFSRVMADSLLIYPKAEVYDVHYNEIVNKGTILGGEYTPLELPLVSVLPEIPAFNIGEKDVYVRKGQSLMLDSGEYRRLVLAKDAVVTFSGGTYSFASVTALQGAKLLFEAPSAVYVSGRLLTGSSVQIAPSSEAVRASDLLWVISAEDLVKGKRTLQIALLGPKNHIAANIYVPQGTLFLNNQTTAEGSFIAKYVVIGPQSILTLDSGW